MKIYLTIIISLILKISLFAQLSPGKLHQSHAQLEGLENCTKCHEIGEKLTSAKCLVCHEILKQRIEKNKGLHSTIDYKVCINCHVDHHGRDYELVYWKGGKEKFDHSITGYSLSGKHKGLECKKCHQPKNISAKELFLSKNKDLKKTFLGLDEDCLSCHLNEHRGQITDPCLSCHTMEGWKPPSKFDHDKTNYALTGKHKNVDCQKCHKITVDNKFELDVDFLKFSGIVFKRCINCHEDFHQNKFGNNCEGCHNTTGWLDYNPERFDHNKTNYPLRGKHLKLECNQCHSPGKPLKIVLFNNCADCHKDYHQGQLSRRKQGGCEDCHTVEGFSPANFTIAQHRETKYPLQGSHLAVPCSACHKKTNRQTKSETVRFRFKSSNCLTCHKDPHQGEVEKYIKKKGCEYCHSVESWRSVTYDHQETKFPLEGRHLTTRCSHCHKAVDVGTPAEHLQFLKLNKVCQWCHEDEHSGQFRENKIFEKTRKNFTRCQRCHTPVDWLAEKFDHDRDAVFKLKGAHKNVSCELCHKKIIKNEKTITLYKPLAKQCRSCHGNAVNKLN